MNFLNDKRVWQYCPVVTSILLEGSTVGHLLRMWRERTAAGQSLLSWGYVAVALLLWYNWYRIFTPEQKMARYTVGLSLVTNMMVLGTVTYFRYFV